MRYALNGNLAAVDTPPIAQAQGWTRDLPAGGRTLLDLAQAVPADPPPAALRQHLAELVAADAGHGYSEILGREGLRAAVATHMAGDYGGSVAAGQAAVTAGCNQAFCYATAAVAGPGDEVILPVPYYFNHQMWLEMQGIQPVHLACDMAGGALPDPEAAARMIGLRTRAIVLVTPNNPTGAVYPPALIEAFFELAKAHRLALIVDETYKDFLTEPRAPHDLFARADWPDALVQLYSFSKTYSLTGHRIGALVADEGLLAAVAKLADCVQICPPVLGQAAAQYALDCLQDHRAARRRQMAQRVADLHEAVAARPQLAYELVSAGAYFAYLRHPFEAETAMAVARRLVREHAVLTLPGTMFGPGQERYLRLAFANLSSEAFPELIDRLLESQGQAAAT